MEMLKLTRKTISLLLFMLMLAWAGIGSAAALTADRHTSHKGSDLLAVPVYTATTIYLGSMVCANTSGYAIPCTDTASLRMLGVATEQIDNTGSSGALEVRVYTSGRFLLSATSITQAMVGQPMLIRDDQTFDDTSSNNVIAGTLVDYISATSGWLDIATAVYNPTSAAAASISVADGGTLLTATNVETALAEIATDMLTAQAFIGIPLTSLRELTTGAIPNAAANGGLLASDSTPILNSTNGDTDGALRLSWAASNSDAIGFQVALPPDLDEAGAMVIHFRGAMNGDTNTVVISADSYFNEGDTKVEDDSAAVTGTTYAEYTITIAAADVPSGAQTLSVELTPAAHTTNILYMTAMWIEYRRLTLTQ